MSSASGSSPQSEFDFVFVGGGTAGLAAASRVAEIWPSLSVLVIEAGQDVSIKPEVRIPALFSQNLGNPGLDWTFFSEPQQIAGGRKIFLPRGKSLGGSSNLNFMQMNRATVEEHDAYKEIGIAGWDWNDIFPYFKKSEKHTSSAESQTDAFAVVDDTFHGLAGPVDTTLPVEISTPHAYFMMAMNELGVPTNADSSSGDNRGVWTSLASVDPVSRTRVSSDTAYLKNPPKNLTIITNARATRILFDDKPREKSIAKGVEYIQDSESKTVYASKEVIISAGTYQTPQILELSGIGDPKIMSQYNIPTIVDLPSVGTNLQEHIYVPLSYEMRPPYESWDVLRNESRAAQEMIKFQTNQTGKLTTVPFAFSYLTADRIWSQDQVEEVVKKMDASPRVHPFTSRLVEIQKQWLKSVSFMEILLVASFMPSDVKQYEDGKSYYTLAACLQHPLSQGSVHIQSGNGTDNPAIDPKFFENSLDLDVILDGIKMCRKIADTEALKEITVGEVSPGRSVGSDIDLKAFVLRNFSPVFHPIGTAAMLPRDLGGVVDAKLKVYGTQNLRVIDASILPLHFGCHPMATIYAMAEKAAYIIGK